jgi:hypothetical protein
MVQTELTGTPEHCFTILMLGLAASLHGVKEEQENLYQKVRETASRKVNLTFPIDLA